MGLFGNMLNALGNVAGITSVQAGSEVLIGRHTSVDPFSAPGHVRAAADQLIKQHFLNSPTPINEFEAALLKLSVYYQAAEKVESEHHMTVLAEAIADLREAAGQGTIRPEISLQVMGDTGA